MPEQPPPSQRRGKPRGMRRDRDCGTCKTRRVKCDLNRPRCLPCVQAGLACGGYPQRVVWTAERADPIRPRRRSTSMLLPQVETEVSGLMTRGAVDVVVVRGGVEGHADDEVEVDGPDKTEKAHQVDKTHQLPPRIDNDSLPTGKHSFVLRLAAFCQHITSAEGRKSDSGRYLSAEAIRLVSRLYDFMQARIDSSSEPLTEEYGESMDVARHRLAVLMELNEALQTANPFAILGIAAFAVFEVSDCAFGEWRCHLYGARSLLDCHCQSRRELEQLSRSVTGLTEILARLVWFDAMGTVVRGTTDLIFDDWHRGMLNEEFFDAVGCPADTFQLFVDVAKGEAASNPMKSCLRAMDQLFQLDADTTDWKRCANANRCAVALAVLERMPSDEEAASRHKAMLSAVDRICEIVALTPRSSPLHVHLATPVYLAGMNATTARHCAVVRTYWLDCDLAGVPRYLGSLARFVDKWRMKGLV
ncbi:hypothetical protein EDB81DRAFT_801932 [Dactylonectria macrodidyma]|uniref:Zn(2)-C6 fungal-type domain-containing protein n=1 Tax=Dactylonectria macrodidyma TaxID=307937 RepID=A0A9P9IUU2_9HYPO|nr:hypothetical protein EDB81DRAFT_801932 [Dactylonectria macrodidyma]